MGAASRALIVAPLLAIGVGAGCNAVIGLSEAKDGAGGASASATASSTASSTGPGKPCVENKCDDGVQDCDETGVDCGGTACKVCGGDPCMFNGDCKSDTCVMEGYCCAETCKEPCTACDLPGAEGKCEPLQDGFISGCEPGSACYQGECNSGNAVGDTCMKNGDCQSNDCVDAVCLGGQGWYCTSDDQCASGSCNESACE